MSLDSGGHGPAGDTRDGGLPLRVGRAMGMVAAAGATVARRFIVRETAYGRAAVHRVAVAHRAMARRAAEHSRPLWTTVARTVVHPAVMVGRVVAWEAAVAQAALRGIAAGLKATARLVHPLWTAVERPVAAAAGVLWRGLGREAAFGRVAVHRIVAAHKATVRLVADRIRAGWHATWGAPGRLWALVRDSGRRRVAARVEARRAAAEQREAARKATMLQQAATREAARQKAVERAVALRIEARRQTVVQLLARERARRRRRRRLAIAFPVVVLLAIAGFTVGVYYVDGVPAPGELDLPESTMVYFSDGRTPMAKLGRENRTILAYDEMIDAVKNAIVAAEDRTFWTHGGVNLGSVMRAAWNNATGGAAQGGSTITQQYARIAADLRGFTYSRKLREAVIAWKLDKTRSKEEILAFYLNTVPFGRGAYGIEAAAQAFFGKSASRHVPAAGQVTVAEAMFLAVLVKQPEPDPEDPEAYPGYDPARGGLAAANSTSRWEYVREGMVELGYLPRARADALAYPHTVRDPDTIAASGMDGPAGHVVNHALSELRQSTTFRNKPADHILNGGFRIVTTIDKRAQDAAEAAADLRRATAPAAVQGQPANWQAALVAVQPGTGRVLAYFGGLSGTGADHAGWFYDNDGQPRGFGQHPPGSSFKVYDLAEALRQGTSVQSRWNSPATKEFPASGRTRTSAAGPVRNSTAAACQPDCTLVEATVASLNVTFFELTERLGIASVLDMARGAGIDSMWTDRAGQPAPVRVDLRGKEVTRLAEGFTTEVGIGQYGVTVLDHANGMATFAADGKRAQAHFVREVLERGERVYAEQLTQSDTGLTPAQVDELTWTLSQVPAARLANGWDAAGKTGTWQAANNTTRNAHTWMVGYTGALAAAVWLGTTDGQALHTADGKYDVTGASHAATVWRQFLTSAVAALGLDPREYAFRAPQSTTQAQLPSAQPPG